MYICEICNQATKDHKYYICPDCLKEDIPKRPGKVKRIFGYNDTLFTKWLHLYLMDELPCLGAGRRRRYGYMHSHQIVSDLLTPYRRAKEEFGYAVTVRKVMGAFAELLQTAYTAIDMQYVFRILIGIVDLELDSVPVLDGLIKCGASEMFKGREAYGHNLHHKTLDMAFDMYHALDRTTKYATAQLTVITQHEPRYAEALEINE